MTNHIRGIYNAQMRCTLHDFREIGNDHRVRRISLTFHPEDVPDDEDGRNVLLATRDGHVTLQDGIPILIVEGHHLH